MESGRGDGEGKLRVMRRKNSNDVSGLLPVVDV